MLTKGFGPIFYIIMLLIISGQTQADLSHEQKYCQIALKRMESFGNNPLQEAVQLLKSVQNKTYSTDVVIAYLSQGVPAIQLIRLDSIDQEGVKILTIHNFGDQSHVALDILHHQTPNQLVQIRVVGIIKPISMNHPMEVHRDSEKVHKLHSYVIMPEAIKISQFCAESGGERFKSATGHEISYVNVKGQWQKQKSEFISAINPGKKK